MILSYVKDSNIKMLRSNRVNPKINIISEGNNSVKFNRISLPKENFSETDPQMPFWNMFLYKKIKPLILSLKLCGLIPSHEKRCSFPSALWRCHFYFVFFLMLFNLLRSLLTFDLKDGLGQVFFMKTQWTIWSLENFTKILVFWIGFKRKCRIPLLFLKQDKLFRQCVECFGNLRRIVTVMFVLTILIPTLNVIFYIVCHIMSPQLSELHFASRWPNYLKNSLPMWLKLLFDLPIVYLNSAICMSAVCFFCFMCYLIVKNLENLRINLEKVTLRGILTQDLANYRYRFQELCDVIATLDCSFTYIIFLSLLTGIPLFCVMFYQTIYFSKSIDESAFFGFLLITLLFYMGVFLFLPAWINTETRNLLPVLYKIRVNNALEKQELEMLMFLSQLTGPDIGLSACNLIIITRRTLLTVAGLLLTYFLLLVQYRDSSQDIGCHSDGIIKNITKKT